MKALCLVLVALLAAGCPSTPPAPPAQSTVAPTFAPVLTAAASPTTAATATIAAPSPTAGFLSGTVNEVVDGDTVKVDLGAKVEVVRIIGIDTPETVAPNQPVGCFGKEASAQAKLLLLGKFVTLTPDPTQDRRDKYDRLLAYVTVNGQDFGLLMVADGFAREYTYDRPYQHQAAYRAAQADARARGLGLWSPDTCAGNTGPLAATAAPTTEGSGRGVPPPGHTECPPTHPVKDNITATARVYHVPGGNNYEATAPEVCFATTADAEADGFRAPRN